MPLFIVPGRPGAKARARVGLVGGKARAFNPAQNATGEAVIRGVAFDHFPAPFEGPVRLNIIAFFRPPASWSKKKTAAMLRKPHTQKPDADNIEKLVWDALNRVAYLDDSQIADSRIRKFWSETERTEIFCEPIE